MKNNKRLDGKNMCLALTKKLEFDIRSFCRDKGIESESELVRQAIANYIYTDYKDETLKLQGLKHLQEKVAELRDMLEITFSYIQILHKDNLAYHPDIDTQFADAAFNSANNRYNKIFNVFQDSFKNNPPMFERLLHKYYTEDSNEQT